MDVVMCLFGVGAGGGSGGSENEAAIQFYGGIADPLRAIPKRDANLISRFGLKQTHCNWIIQLM